MAHRVKPGLGMRHAYVEDAMKGSIVMTTIDVMAYLQGMKSSMISMKVASVVDRARTFEKTKTASH